MLCRACPLDGECAWTLQPSGYDSLGLQENSHNSNSRPRVKIAPAGIHAGLKHQAYQWQPEPAGRAQQRPAGRWRPQRGTCRRGRQPRSAQGPGSPGRLPAAAACQRAHLPAAVPSGALQVEVVSSETLSLAVHRMPVILPAASSCSKRRPDTQTDESSNDRSQLGAAVSLWPAGNICSARL